MQNVDAVIAAFDRLVAHDGSKTIIASTQIRVSAAELDRLAHAAGRVIAAARLRRASPVGLWGPNGSGYLAGLVACRRAGHPAALLDSRSTAAEVAGTAAALGLSGVLRIRAAWPSGPTGFAITPYPERATDPAAGDPPAATAVIKMTSGSAGRPRGVATSSEALLADDAAIRAVMRIGSGDRIMATIPFSHSYGLSSLVVPALAHGLTLVVPDTTTPLALIAAAARYEATVLPTVPAWLAAWLQLAEPPPLPGSIRAVITAGAPLPAGTAHAYRSRFGAGLHVFYGASESGGITYDRGGAAGERGTVGEPLPGVRLDLKRVEGHGPGVTGRVVVESQAVALSYVPEADGLLQGGRFVSQDLARWRGTELEILGRLDDMINVRGYKVNPVEVERVIAAMPGVKGVFVHGLNRSSSGDTCVHAVVATPGQVLTAASVIEWCRPRLADYKVPRGIVLVPSLPLTPRGKIDRAAAIHLGRSTRRGGPPVDAAASTSAEKRVP